MDRPRRVQAPWSLAPRAVLALVLLWPLLHLGEFWLHVRGHLTGSIASTFIQGEWRLVLVNIALFLAFLVPLSYRRKAAWGDHGLVAAFFVSLFVEMYGIPLTALLALRLLNPSPSEPPPIVAGFTFMGVGIGMSLAMAYGTALMLLGTALVALGWATLYRHGRDGALVTQGVYSWSRNPQYLGFVLVLLGWLVGWPTPLTLVLVPVLVHRYVRACRAEEGELAGLEGYEEYRARVPFMA